MLQGPGTPHKLCLQQPQQLLQFRCRRRHAAALGDRAQAKLWGSQFKRSQLGACWEMPLGMYVMYVSLSSTEFQGRAAAPKASKASPCFCHAMPCHAFRRLRVLEVLELQAARRIEAASQSPANSLQPGPAELRSRRQARFVQDSANSEKMRKARCSAKGRCRHRPCRCLMANALRPCNQSFVLPCPDFS